MKIFVIGSVRRATEEFKKRLENYVQSLEDEGHKVHLPHRDTDQKDSGLQICKENFKAIKNSDRIDIFYDSKSQGIHFDMGIAFALYMMHGKKIRVVENEEYIEGKSYPKMLDEWERDYSKTYKIVSFTDKETGKTYINNKYHYKPTKHDLQFVIRKRDNTSFGVGQIIRIDSKNERIEDLSETEDGKDLEVKFQNSPQKRYLSELPQPSSALK